MLHNSNDSLKAANLARVGFWELNLKTNKIFWDTTMRSILEVENDYIPNLEEALNFYDSGEDRSKMKSLVERAITKGIPFVQTFQVTTFKNNSKYIESTCQIARKNNKIISILGSCLDITAEQNLINELRLNNEKNSSVFLSTNDAVFIIDAKSNTIRYCNSRAFELSEYHSLELIGQDISVLFTRKQASDFTLFLEKTIANEHYLIGESNLTTKSGNSIPVEIAAEMKIQTDKSLVFICFFRDISVRKKEDEQIKMLSLAASETTDTIIIANDIGEFLWANNAYLELCGYSVPELMLAKPGHLSKGPETDPNTTDQIREAIKAKRSITVDILNYNKKKEKYWFELSINPIFDPNGLCTNFVSVGRDITLRKEKELQLKKLAEEMSLQNSKLINFTHIVSHNIRSHASNLSMLVDLIENSVNPKDKISYFELFKEGTDKLSETIEYLNEIITIDKNTGIQKKTIFLNEEIEKTKQALSLLIRDSGLEIINLIPPQLKVKVIPAYLDSILINLMTNAIKYKARNRKSTLEISHQMTESHCIINFKDNGLGINLNRHGDKIFGMYKTFHGNEDAKGIGLFITKNQLEAMNGKIEVESAEGLGSTFKIYFYDK